MSIHDGHRQRIRKQIQQYGLDSLSDIQFLEYTLFFVIPRCDTNELAHRLLERFGSLDRVIEAPAEELRKVSGIGERAAELLSLFWPMEKRHQVAKSKSLRILPTSEDCADYLLPYFIGETEEVVYLLCLDAKCKVLDCSLVHRGAVNSVAISARKILKKALDQGATAVFLAHNHPSGIALPSKEDIDATLYMKDALDAVDVLLIDHIVVADNDYVSLAADGVL